MSGNYETVEYTVVVQFQMDVNPVLAEVQLQPCRNCEAEKKARGTVLPDPACSHLCICTICMHARMHMYTFSCFVPTPY